MSLKRGVSAHGPPHLFGSHGQRPCSRLTLSGVGVIDIRRFGVATYLDTSDQLLFADVWLEAEDELVVQLTEHYQGERVRGAAHGACAISCPAQRATAAAELSIGSTWPPTHYTD